LAPILIHNIKLQVSRFQTENSQAAITKSLKLKTYIGRGRALLFARVAHII